MPWTSLCKARGPRWTTQWVPQVHSAAASMRFTQHSIQGCTAMQVAVGGTAGQQLMAAAQVSGIPHAFVVDRGGIVQFSGHPMDPDFAAAVQKVRTFAAAACMQLVSSKFAAEHQHACQS